LGTQNDTSVPRKTNPLINLLERWGVPEEVVLLGTALVVGLSTGIGGVLFRYLIRGVELVCYHWVPQLLSNLDKAYVVLMPALGGLFVGLLVYFFAREAKGHGVPEVMEAVALRGGRIRPQVAFVKALASSLSIGSGGSVGREGPIVQIGSALGSSIGQFLNLSDERIRNLVACGAAGGIAATFNAPIAGVIFALEVILGRFDVRYFSSVVISAVSADVIGRMVFGNVPAFRIPVEYGIHSLWEFLFYPFLGVLAALVGVAFMRVLYASEDFFDSWRIVPEWVRPAIGGVLLGLLALAYPLITGVTWDTVPQIFNVGYDVIESVLANQLPLFTVLALLVLKLIATSLTLGSGGSGGVFAPSLFLGSMLGAAFALVVERIFPGISAPAGAYALVGMAAVFAASAHAPITAVLILFELTGDYRIILPLMLTVVIATVISQRISKDSIYTLKLTRRGVHLQRGRDIDVLQSVQVGEVMTYNAETVPMDMTIGDLSQVFTRTRHHGLLVLDLQGKLWGIVTVRDLDRAWASQKSRNATVASIGTTWPYLKVAFPDETMGEALRRMGVRGLGRMPVVSRDDPYELLGLIRREDIIKAYDLALTRRSEIQSQIREEQIRGEEGTEFVEIILTPDDNAVGKQLQDLACALPTECILVSIRRKGRVLIPRGDTVFQAGDHITAFTRQENARNVLHCLRRSPGGQEGEA
jgi:chloride channel protein, CIC family